ncbi:MAG TPA: DUF4214 domain-containing protein [Pirellulales bacterium]|nr:DUF4214 domain-containing protein [Pirellulales bacterium]
MGPSVRHVEINTLFEQYLGRPADAAALASFDTFLAAGGTDEQLAVIITSSAEFCADAGGTNAAFLNSLFGVALHRSIEASSEAAFEQDMANGTSRAQVAAIVFGSHQYHVDLVDELYIDLLGRPADSDGQSYWSAQLDQGTTDEQAITALAASDEFFAKAS